VEAARETLSDVVGNLESAAFCSDCSWGQAAAAFFWALFFFFFRGGLVQSCRLFSVLCYFLLGIGSSALQL
jgi:hypothetical protein